MAAPYRIVVSVAPSTFPVTLAEAKLHLRVDTAAEDDLLDDLIAAATDAAEKHMGRALITRTYKLYYDSWPAENCPQEWWDGVREGAFVGAPLRAVELPYPPLISVVAINSYSDDDTATLWAGTNYHVDTKSTPGRIALKQGGIVPLPTKTINGIEVEYTAGYGDAGDVPTLIKSGILRLIAHMYENRGDDAEAALASSGAGRMLGQYKIMRLS